MWQGRCRPALRAHCVGPPSSAAPRSVPRAPTNPAQVGRDGRPHPDAASAQPLADGELEVEQRDPLEGQGHEVGDEEGPCKRAAVSEAARRGPHAGPCRRSAPSLGASRPFQQAATPSHGGPVAGASQGAPRVALSRAGPSLGPSAPRCPSSPRLAEEGQSHPRAGCRGRRGRAGPWPLPGPTDPAPSTSGTRSLRLPGPLLSGPADTPALSEAGRPCGRCGHPRRRGMVAAACPAPAVSVARGGRARRLTDRNPRQERKPSPLGATSWCELEVGARRLSSAPRAGGRGGHRVGSVGGKDTERSGAPDRVSRARELGLRAFPVTDPAKAHGLRGRGDCPRPRGRQPRPAAVTRVRARSRPAGGTWTGAGDRARPAWPRPAPHRAHPHARGPEAGSAWGRCERLLATRRPEAGALPTPRGPDSSRAAVTDSPSARPCSVLRPSPCPPAATGGGAVCVPAGRGRLRPPSGTAALCSPPAPWGRHSCSQRDTRGARCPLEDSGTLPVSRGSLEGGSTRHRAQNGP